MLHGETIENLSIGDYFVFVDDIGTTAKTPVYKVISSDKVMNFKTGAHIQFKQLGLNTCKIARLDLWN